MTNRHKAVFEKVNLGNNINAVHLVLPSEINGEKWYWIIDTGASNSTVNRDYSQLFSEITPMQEQLVTASEFIEDGTLESAVIGMVDFGSFRIKDLSVVLIDIKHICDIFEKEIDIKVCGLLGADFMFRHKVKMDFESMDMELVIS
ncbi:MAG: aspartyl protease family protein [Bacteroidales bacterium]